MWEPVGQGYIEDITLPYTMADHLAIYIGDADWHLET